MTETERNKYLEAYYANEADANKQMSFANVAAAVYMLVLWILYLTDRFHMNTPITRVLVNVSFPIGILILLSPLLYVFIFKDKLKEPNYKLFVLFSFVVVIGALNLILPKHTVIAWALCIIMTNHYYNPKVGLMIFISVIVLSLVAMYGSMFVGEFDANLLYGNVVLEHRNEFSDVLTKNYIEGPQGRYKLLHDLLVNHNVNRYVDALLLYFLPRSVLLALVFFVSHSLNIRTYKLLVSEIKVNSDQKKISTELEVAKDIQLATLPSEVVSSKDIEIVAELRAAKEVGGDFYDYFKVDDDHVAIVVGDISGKGVPAALFMMKTITCFKNFMAPNKSPAEIMRQVNAALYDNNQSQMFVTCFLAILNIKNGELVFANAGHNPPIIGRDLHYQYLKCKSGFILGGLEDAFVTDETITLNRGDSITLYTDGVTEARDEKGDFYGEQRFLDVCNSKEYTCLLEMHHNIKDNLNMFTGKAEQSDDITILSLRYSGDECIYKEKMFDGKIENIEEGLLFVKQFCDEQQLPAEFKNNLLIVADELYSNIVKYGYQDEGGDVFTRLLYNKNKNEFVITIIDRAPAFNQLDINNSPLDDDFENRKVGGLGILIVKKIMSQYAYDRINNKNILVLRKTFK